MGAGHRTSGAWNRACLTVAMAVVSLACAASAHAQDNAAPLWRRAFETAGFGRPQAAHVVSDDDWNYLSDHAPPYSPEERARVDQILERTAGIRAQFAAAARVKRCDWDHDVSQGPMMLMPELSQLRMAARLLRAEAQVELEDGKPADAVATMLLLGNMGVQSGQERNLIGSLVGTAIGGTMMPELAQDAIDGGALDEKAAQGMLDALGPLAGDDPFRYADAVRGEGEMLAKWLGTLKSDEDFRTQLAAFGTAVPDDVRSMGIEQARREAADAKPLFERAAAAFGNPDPNAAMAELRRIQQFAEGGRAGALVRMTMPETLKAFQGKLRGQQALALLVAKLRKIAEGKEKPADLRNGALLLARASAGARAVADDAQEAVELLRVAPDAATAEQARRAAEILDRAGRSTFAPLADAVTCRRVDFDRLVPLQPELSVRLLGGIRGAVRMSLARGLQAARAARCADAAAGDLATAYRVSALLASDPSLPRALLAAGIWREATAALADAAAAGPPGKEAADRIERAMASMPAADPFGLRRALEKDAERVVGREAIGQSGAATPEARAARVHILRQRGLGAMMVLAAGSTLEDSMPDPKAPPLVRVTDVFPADACRRAAAELHAAAQKLDDRRGGDRVPWDLPLDEQKSRYRRLDPTRGIVFVDMASVELNAGADYAKAFDALKAACRPPG